MKAETVKKANELSDTIRRIKSQIADLRYVINERNLRGPNVYLKSNDYNVRIGDKKIQDIIFAILESDFADKLKKAEQEFADLKDE